MDNFLTTQNINFLLVFIEGILSFLSPCVLPLIPIYIGYLAGNGKRETEDGSIFYERKIVFLNTVLFVIGISFAFFLLGMSFSVLGSFLNKYKQIFSSIAGAIIIFMGLMQLGIIKIPFLEKEHKIPFLRNGRNITPVIALIMGFTFSFAWTPCIGPALASVLALASSSSNVLIGNLLVVTYTVGFAIPFLLVGLFTTKVLNFFSKRKKIVQYTIKISGTILIIMGIFTLTGMTEKIGAELGNINNNNETAQKEENESNNETSSTNKKNARVAPDFTLLDQNGNTHTLSEYEGKVIFLNFWATWCPPCKEELPYIQEIYEEYKENSENVIILGIVNPKTPEYKNSQDTKSEEEIKEFLKQNKISYPVLFDKSGKIFDEYRIQAFPTTFMIDIEGRIFGYVPGALTKNNMNKIIEQTMDGTKK